MRDSDSATVWIESDGFALSTDDTTVAVVGLHDVVVIHTPNDVLVTSREHAQQVKQVPAAVRAAGRDDVV